MRHRRARVNGDAGMDSKRSLKSRRFPVQRAIARRTAHNRREAESALLENNLGLRRGQPGYGELLLEIHTYPACQSGIDVDQIALGIIFDE